MFEYKYLYTTEKMVNFNGNIYKNLDLVGKCIDTVLQKILSEYIHDKTSKINIIWNVTCKTNLKYEIVILLAENCISF